MEFIGKCDLAVLTFDCTKTGRALRKHRLDLVTENKRTFSAERTLVVALNAQRATLNDDLICRNRIISIDVYIKDTVLRKGQCLAGLEESASIVHLRISL